jgi:hypothetical protein
MTIVTRRSALLGWKFSARHFPLVAFPSSTVDHFVPSCDTSYIKLYEVGEVTFIGNRPFMVMSPIFWSFVQVQVSPTTEPLESSNSPQLLPCRRWNIPESKFPSRFPPQF